MDSLLPWIEHYGYLGLFASLMLGIFGLPVPDETILAFTGFLIHQQTLGLAPSLAAAFLGSASGMSVNYVVGRLLGLAFLRRYGPRLGITPGEVIEAHSWFERYGKWLLPVGYFLPGLRHLTPFVAGATRLRFAEFALFAFSGGFCWVSTFILLGYSVGKGWSKLLPRLHMYLWAAAGGLALLALLYLGLRLRRRARLLGPSDQAPRSP